MRYFIIGILKIILLCLISPLIIPLGFITLIYCIGGQEIVETPLVKVFEYIFLKFEKILSYKNKEVNI